MRPQHGYGGYYGMPALRAGNGDLLPKRFGVELDPDTEVAPLIGSKEGIVNTALAFVDPGSVVLVPDPGYPTYTLGTLLAGGETYPVPLLAENDFLPDLDAIPEDVVRSARILWLNYPNNPTGAVAPLSFFERAVAFGKQHDVLICHDNPYCDVTFGGYAAPSILQVPGAMDVALEFNSLSKAYNMAGWRVGMAVGNASGSSGTGPDQDQRRFGHFSGHPGCFYRGLDRRPVVAEGAERDLPRAAGCDSGWSRGSRDAGAQAAGQPVHLG